MRLACLTGALLAGTAAGLVGLSPTHGSGTSAPSDTKCTVAGSWAHSPTGAWMRRVVEVAGYELAGCTESAWIGVTPLTRFTIWASAPWRRPPGTRPYEERHLREAFSDGNRVLWRAQGLTIWVAPGPGEADVLPGKTALAWLQAASRGLPRRYAPLAFMPTPAAALRACRSDAVLAPACPTKIPRVHLPPGVAGWRTYPSPPRRVTGIFGMERGGEIPGKPELMRPPSILHVEVEAARRRKPLGIGFSWPTSGAVEPRDGLVREERQRAVLLGRVAWGGKAGTVVLAPPYPSGGSQGNHVVFRWRAGRTTYLVGMHAWEPFSEAYATLRRIVSSLPR